MHATGSNIYNMLKIKQKLFFRIKYNEAIDYKNVKTDYILVVVR